MLMQMPFISNAARKTTNEPVSGTFRCSCDRSHAFHLSRVFRVDDAYARLSVDRLRGAWPFWDAAANV